MQMPWECLHGLTGSCSYDHNHYRGQIRVSRLRDICCFVLALYSLFLFIYVGLQGNLSKDPQLLYALPLTGAYQGGGVA